MYKQLDKPLQDYLLKQTELLIELNNKIWIKKGSVKTAFVIWNWK
jgi:hypothetical protein